MRAGLPTHAIGMLFQRCLLLRRSGYGGMRERICGREARGVCCGMQGAIGTGYAGRGMHTPRGQESWNGMERYEKQL